MTTMDRYTCFCTKEQPKKALKLGAPIELCPSISPVREKKFYIEELKCWYFIPTAEQMVYWLEKRKVFVHIDPCFDISCHCHFSTHGDNKHGYVSKVEVYKSRKEATLAVIDAALEYLAKNTNYDKEN